MLSPYESSQLELTAPRIGVTTKLTTIIVVARMSMLRTNFLTFITNICRMVLYKASRLLLDGETRLPVLEMFSIPELFFSYYRS
jgi:hypothetical protein